VTERLERGTKVRQPDFGNGEVQADLGFTAIVRFGDEIRECDKSELVLIESVADALKSGVLHPPLEVVLRAQAECICSVNNAWGIFARSRIALLPHQLWVCRKVLESWPARWLVADDVGLGKTVEAGLILSALMSRQRLRRLLILCPASLVEQWQYRMRTMFDIHTSVYSTTADTPRSDFWNSHHAVVASLHTLKLDQNNRLKRILESEPWDLVVVDEAHHLNADEQSGPTQGYRLIQSLQEARRIRSMLFFTGTPHRGKPYGFFSLLALLRPESFGPKRAVDEQLAALPSVMIRNNKQNVTDLRGNRIFHSPVVVSHTYAYSLQESAFYGMLTEFILSGKTYASNLGGRDGRAVMLVLIAMQKLASSSVAAIVRALKGRLARMKQSRENYEQIGAKLLAELESSETEEHFDQSSVLEDELAQLSLQLMAGEQSWLEGLIVAAEEIKEESKIQRVIEYVAELKESESVLFFTEYKATQSLLMSALIRVYGEQSVAFINGDGEARDVVCGETMRTLRSTRARAADDFNSGTVRFLVSTEAAGEGIDLQENCCRLVHVDLPWNPMRLHQRVGRLNRFGQKRQVHVTSFRNPSTVESRIWDKLNEKIEHINQALQQVMPDPEDLYELVLGMAQPKVLKEVFSNAATVPNETFDDWFDKETASFGKSDVIDTVRDLVGNVARFEFDEVSERIPKVELQDLAVFFSGMLVHKRRQPRNTEFGLSFKTPDDWLSDPAILSEYEGLRFDRNIRDKDADRLLGVGHKLVDMALNEALAIDASVTAIPNIQWPVVVCKVFDRVTTGEGLRQAVVCGVEVSLDSMRCFADWELLKLLNLNSPFSLRGIAKVEAESRASIATRTIAAAAAAKEFVLESGASFRHADCEILCVFVPQPSESPTLST
jgi:ERCC4-related helicase